MYELLLHSIFLLFLSDLSQNRKCTNTSHTEPKMTDFCKQYRIPQYIICTNCTSYLWMLAWRWYNKTETCCHNKTLLFINCYVLGVTLKYFVLLVSLSTLSSASFLKTRHDAILQMYELLLHSIFLLFLSDLSQNRKCTNTSHTEPKMTDFFVKMYAKWDCQWWTSVQVIQTEGLM